MAAPIVDPDDALLDKLAGVASAPGAAPRRALSDDELLNQLSGTTAPAAPAPRGPAAPVAPDNTDYENMTLGQAAYKGLGNLGASAKGKFQAIGHAVMNPSETASAIGQIGTGLYSKAKGMFVDQDPAEKAKAEAIVNALGQHYADTYGSWAGFKKTLATDPFDIGMDVASLVPGVGAAGRAAGLTTEAAGAAGKIAQLGSAAGKAASMLDPVQAAIAAGSKVGSTAAKAADWATTGTQSVLSGVPKSLLGISREAGATTDAENALAYKKFQRGQGSISEIADTAMDGVDELKQQASDSYLQDKANLAKSQVQLPMNKIQAKLDELNDFMNSGGTSNRFSNMRGIVQDINDQINATRLSKDPTARTMVDLDNLKQSIGSLAGNAPGAFKGKIGDIASSIRETIADQDSKYADMMDNWSNWKDELNNFQKTLGLNNKATDAARLAKMLKEAKGTDMPLINKLAQTQSGKTLPYMLAGMATHPWVAQGLHQYIEYPVAGLAALTHPATWPGIVGGALASSPRLGGATQYAVGKAGKYLAPVGTAADYATSVPATYGATRLGQAELQQHAAGGRIGRKTGGAVRKDAKAEAHRLIALSEKIRKKQAQQTEPLLNLDDTTVAKALEIANRGK